MFHLQNLKLDRIYKITLTLFILLSMIFLMRLNLVILSIEWVNFFKLENFKSLDDVVTFYRDLRTGVSPILSFFEIIEYLWTGDAEFFRIWVSRVIIFLNFLMASHLYASEMTKIYRLTLSVIFVAALSLIGGMNYDWFWPFFILGHLYFLKCAQKEYSVFFSILSGLFLTCAELSRPFVLFVVPILVFNFYLRMKKKKKLYLILFLTPLILVSGGWRVKLYQFNGPQIIWSDYGGCNVYEAWPVKGKKLGYEYLNTAKGSRLCREGKDKVVKHMLSHPVETAVISFKKIWSFLKAKAFWHGMGDVRVNYSYRFVLKILLLVYFFQGFTFLYRLKNNIRILLREEELVRLMTYAYFIFLTIPNDGSERARFVASFTPFLLLTIHWECWESIKSKVVAIILRKRKQVI